ncbi:uncharacterized protein DSM5745_10139 [Aspergillus mulundensis]|uniref:Uncharacterized protein n=1 Tax=Aspergillus mulundensis TaxID=1810919 RepID=A0A3D8QMV4_9EURO|nr:Uncharacterized protein DSM5745_10139 [Aspergillus mulundensis]RDW63028.1 Uncharacterized protein DSM5745_10139 [Aspergillus mulundensis]
METVQQVAQTAQQAVQSASNAVWNEIDALRSGQETEQRVPQQQQQHGDEPMSGIQGKGTATDPYDAGNRDEQLGAPISKNNTAVMTEPLSSTMPGTFQDKYQNPNANRDGKAALVTSNIGPSNPSIQHPDPVVGKQHTSGPAGKSILKDEPLSTHGSTLKDEPLSTHGSTLKDESLTSRPKPSEPTTAYDTRSANAAHAAEKVNEAGSSAGLGSGVAAGAGAGSLSGSTAAPTAKPSSEQRGNLSFGHAQSVGPKDEEPSTSGLGATGSLSQSKDKKPSTSATRASETVGESKAKQPSGAGLSAGQAPKSVTETSAGPQATGAGAAPTNVTKDEVERKEPSTSGPNAGDSAETAKSGDSEASTHDVAEKNGVSEEALRGPECPPPRQSYENQMKGVSEKKDDSKTTKSDDNDKKEKHHSSMKEKLNKVLHHH